MDQEIIKQLPIKGVHNQALPFQKYLELISQEALSEWKSWRYSRIPRYGQGHDVGKHPWVMMLMMLKNNTDPGK